MKTVYPGMTVQVRFTVKGKEGLLARDGEAHAGGCGEGDREVPRGPACRQAGVFDETGETVAIATILTMVKKIDQT